MSSYDISRLVRIEFNRSKEIFSTFAHTDALNHLERRQIALGFLRSASATVAAEEAVLLPTLREHAEAAMLSTELIERAAERRAGLKRALEQLDASPRADPRFDAKVERCWILLSAAFHETDQRLLPPFDRHASPRAREGAGRRFYLFRLLLAPTHPHPRAPSCSTAVGLALNCAMAPFDWAHDLLRFGPAMPL